MKGNSLYINRELSWLEFNERVLEEAFDKTNPLLERFKFLAISASNLDEFFMVRVAGLMEQTYAGRTKKDIAGLTPEEQLCMISERAHEMMQKQYSCLIRSLLPSVNKKGILTKKPSSLTGEQKEYVKHFFNNYLFPVLTPMAIDSSRPFPFLANKSVNIIVSLNEDNFAVVQVPSGIKRLLKLPGEGTEFVLIDDIIKDNINKLFEGYKVKSTAEFRITRNSDLEIEEDDSHDLLEEIEESIKHRKWGDPVRLEVEDDISNSAFEYLKEKLSLKDRDIYRVNGFTDLTVCFLLAGIEGFDELKDKPLPPVAVKAFKDRDMFEVIREGDVLVHHPYESFDCVVDFVTKAANDEKVLAIKQTLYRVSGNSPIIGALIKAAENGKQVTVLVELKARFDEENNITWARLLEKAGCHVVYGLVGLKTHCKICMVVRNEEEGIVRYVHLGTGNYNDKTARLYTDLGLFTAKESFGADVSALFNVLTGYSKNNRYTKLAVAPTGLRSMFLENIANETRNSKSGIPAVIKAKLNSLVDEKIINALYDASNAGVKIELVVRGICCLRPGIKGVSENIKVTSIVGRFLEHSRMYYFENGGESKVYLASADWMPRNLDRRVETAFPIESPNIKEKVISALELTLSDTVKARHMQSDGSYKKADLRGKEKISAQREFYERAIGNNK